DDVSALYPQAELDLDRALPAMVALNLRSRDLPRAADHLTQWQVAYEELAGGTLLVPPEEANGALLVIQRWGAPTTEDSWPTTLSAWCPASANHSLPVCLSRKAESPSATISNGRAWTTRSTRCSGSISTCSSFTRVAGRSSGRTRRTPCLLPAAISARSSAAIRS